MAQQTKEQNKEYIAALLEERRGYALHGKTDMVAGVDAELARVGHKAKAPAKRATKMKAKKGTEL